MSVIPNRPDRSSTGTAAGECFIHSLDGPEQILRPREQHAITM